MSPVKNLKVAVAQMTSIDDGATNWRVILEMVRDSASKEAELVVFPENSAFLRLNPRAPLQELDLDGPEARTLSQTVMECGLDVLLTTPTPGAGLKSRNSTVHFAPGAAPKIVYSKIHMFDVDVDGAPPSRESERFISGDAPSIVEIRGWKLGLSICYDVRFPELYLHYADRADAILVPAAFLVPTGEAHWHVLMRARAIENQCYVVAPAQTGEHKSPARISRKTFGHSLVVDPWGRIESDNDGGPGVKIVELQAEKITSVRKQIPMRHHRRMLKS